jgi:hypothetical protein
LLLASGLANYNVTVFPAWYSNLAISVCCRLLHQQGRPGKSASCLPANSWFTSIGSYLMPVDVIQSCTFRRSNSWLK